MRDGHTWRFDCTIKQSFMPESVWSHIKTPTHFQFWTSFFFLLELFGSGLGLMIFHKTSPRTRANYL